MPQHTVIAYTDGSCIGNPGPGGWAVHAELPDGRVVELGGGELETTNNRMELRAAIEALRLVTAYGAATIITDSSYVQGGITSWVAGWKRNGWRTKEGRPVENQALWLELDGLANDQVTWQWTRAHVGTPGNERCDQIARWFAESIRPVNTSQGRAKPEASTPARRPAPAGTGYLSLVDGIVARHRTWAECQQRVHGVRGARFKKVRGPEEERATVAGWGLRPDALEYV